MVFSRNTYERLECDMAANKQCCQVKMPQKRQKFGKKRQRKRQIFQSRKNGAKLAPNRVLLHFYATISDTIEKSEKK